MAAKYNLYLAKGYVKVVENTGGEIRFINNILCAVLTETEPGAQYNTADAGKILQFVYQDGVFNLYFRDINQADFSGAGLATKTWAQLLTYINATVLPPIA